MDFDHYEQSSQQPKQRRKRAGKRRMRNKLPVAARIALDPQLRGNVGVLSEDLANDLFAQQTLQGELNKRQSI
jgi:peroxin-6